MEERRTFTFYWRDPWEEDDVWYWREYPVNEEFRQRVELRRAMENHHRNQLSAHIIAIKCTAACIVVYVALCNDFDAKLALTTFLTLISILFTADPQLNAFTKAHPRFTGLLIALLITHLGVWCSGDERDAALPFAVLRIWAAFGLELALMLAWNYQVNHDLV